MKWKRDSNPHDVCRTWEIANARFHEPPAFYHFCHSACHKNMIAGRSRTWRGSITSTRSLMTRLPRSACAAGMRLRVISTPLQSCLLLCFCLHRVVFLDQGDSLVNLRRSHAVYSTSLLDCLIELQRSKLFVGQSLEKLRETQ